jgi:hypothetical protein
VDVLTKRYRVDYCAGDGLARTVGRYLSEQGAQTALRIHARELRRAGRPGRVVVLDLTADPARVVGVRDIRPAPPAFGPPPGVPNPALAAMERPSADAGRPTN